MRIRERAGFTTVAVMSRTFDSLTGSTPTTSRRRARVRTLALIAFR
jgi:transcriptional regulator GlxA family with amidase domain